MDDSYKPLPAEEKLGVLTAINRTEWAQIRRSFFNVGVNRNSLDAIEKAAFFVSLDDVPYVPNPVSYYKYQNNKHKQFKFLGST